MRDFRLQTLVNCAKILKKKQMSIGELTEYLWYWMRPTGSKKVSANKMFDLNDLAVLRPGSHRLGKVDPTWFPRLIEPTSLGIRAWEYGILLSNTTFRKKSVLDAGCGNSRLPLHLCKLGASVTILDMDEPLEDTVVKKDKNLKFVLGDMTKLSFPNNKFDRVICISAVEHVDMKSGGKFYDEKEYINRALQSIRELARVTKTGGVLYLTTDFFLPQQTTDKWVGSDKEIRGGFPWKCIDLFVKEMENSGIRLEGNRDFNEEDLLKSKQRANYRGRYFTTIAFKGVKS